MYLHRLELGALGPFAGTHTIDFGELGASGLYLLEGPTGAGKSTVIDAVVFALYGKVASEAASDDRLRSGYAPDDVDTFVDLVFETGSGVYRVRRQPERLRAKKRGTGTTKQQASVKLWRLPDPGDREGGELVSTRLDEAGAEIQRVIGLDRAQFVQTIVLPQGEFASFLRAKPEERRGLLQKVFGTQVYERVQDQLAVMRRDALAAVDAARAAVSGAAAHFVGAASVSDDPAWAAGRARAAAGTGAPEDAGLSLDTHPGPGALATATELRALGDRADAGLLLAAQQHAAALAHEAAHAVDRDAAAQHELERARTALDDARTLAEALARRDILRTEHARLQAAAGDQAQAVARVDLARRAAVVGGALTGADDARRAAGEADAHVQALRARSPELAALDGAELAEARESLAAEAARLVRVELLERTLPARRGQLAAEEGMLADDAAERADLRAELAERPALRARLADVIDDLADSAAELRTWRADLAGARDRHDAARRAQALETELVTARQRASIAADAALRAVGAEADLRSRRLAGMAGELAADLVPGGPCPVCGGTEHPSPAVRDADHPDADAVAAAETRRLAAESAVGDASAEVGRLVERVAAQWALAGDVAMNRHESRVTDLARRVAEAEEATARLAAARQELMAHDAETDVLLDRSRTLDVAVATRSTRIDGLLTALEADTKEVDAARVGAPSVAAHLTEIRAQAQALADLASAMSSAAAAHEDLRRRTGELERSLAAQGFPDTASARAAIVPAADVRRLEDAIARHAAALSRVEAGLAEPAVAHLPEVVTVDVAAARGTCTAAESAASEAARRAALATRCADAASDALTAVADALADHARARATAEPVIRMADLAAASGGDNAQRLTLATYVLARRFEDVVAAANDRLAGMSDGRFELVRSQDREDVRSLKRGLAMKVLDHRLEAERDPRTLSGGETFYVSLCLALGMADVVTAEAGGIDLGTLFVDEGFGTLDPETLEAVLDELGKLRAGGRVVGVVSHVEALKQAIADRIEVRRLSDGSSTLTVRAG